MKKLIILTIILLFAAPVHGADADPEMQKLQSVVAYLRKGGEKAFRNAVSKLSSDKLWTPMDELRINRNAECRISDGVAGFRLNAVMTNAENAERYQTTTGLYLNGADMRYNYSLVEKTIKAKNPSPIICRGAGVFRHSSSCPTEVKKRGLRFRSSMKGKNFPSGNFPTAKYV